MIYLSDTDKKDRRRLLIVAGATLILILVLVIAIVAVATKKSNKAKIGETNTPAVAEVEKVNEKGDEDTPVVEKTDDKEDKPVISENTNDQPVVVSNNNTSDIPTTGPEEIMPLAFVLGMGAMYVSSAIIAKKNA